MFSVVLVPVGSFLRVTLFRTDAFLLLIFRLLTLLDIVLCCCTFTFTILQVFPLYKAYCICSDSVRFVKVLNVSADRLLQGGKTFCASLIAGSRRAFLCVDCVRLVLEF